MSIATIPLTAPQMPAVPLRRIAISVMLSVMLLASSLVLKPAAQSAVLDDVVPEFITDALGAAGTGQADAFSWSIGWTSATLYLNNNDIQWFFTVGTAAAAGALCAAAGGGWKGGAICGVIGGIVGKIIADRQAIGYNQCRVIKLSFRSGYSNKVVNRRC